MKLTRRDTAKLALASATLAATPLAAGADWATRLETTLNAAVKGTRARFRVTDARNGTEVELTWRPGIRRRVLRAEGYEALEAEAFETFKDALPKLG